MQGLSLKKGVQELFQRHEREWHWAVLSHSKEYFKPKIQNQFDLSNYILQKNQQPEGFHHIVYF